jgi:hypothetical protein
LRRFFGGDDTAFRIFVKQIEDTLGVILHHRDVLVRFGFEGN